MRGRILLLGVVLSVPLAGCAGETREWMKVGQSYTVQEFRRDHAECTRNDKLDEVCMRSRGWVDVNPKAEKAEKAPETLQDPKRSTVPRR